MHGIQYMIFNSWCLTYHMSYSHKVRLKQSTVTDLFVSSVRLFLLTDGNGFERQRNLFAGRQDWIAKFGGLEPIAVRFKSA